MVGSIIHEDLDMQKLSAKWVPKCLYADQECQWCQLSEQLLEFFRRNPNDFLSQLVTMDKTWLYHYDLKTKQQSMEWQHSGSPCPKKIPSAKIHWKSSCLDFFGSRRHPPHWSSKEPDHQHAVVLISAGATEGHFEGKTLQEGHQGGLVLARQCPGSPGTCNPVETGLPGLPVSWSPTLFSGFGPVPWTEKTIERSPFFAQRGGHCCRGDLVGRTTFWIFFEWLAKVRRSMLNKSWVWSL